MKKNIVFDFDKTLTYRDTLTQLFNSRLNEYCCIYRFSYILFKVLSKFRIISVRKEKELAIRLLYNSNEDSFYRDCDLLSEKIEFTPIYKLLDKHIENGDRVIIVSATAEFLLEKVFANKLVECFGTRFYCEHGKIKSIIQHPYGTEKMKVLLKQGIKVIDEMYYDSKSDEYLVPLCKCWNKVCNGKIINRYTK